jgi:hypothetical protein
MVADRKLPLVHPLDEDEDEKPHGHRDRNGSETADLDRIEGRAWAR